MEDAEAASLLGERSLGRPARFKTYRRRWFLLAAVCLLNCSNAMVSVAWVCHRSGRHPLAAWHPPTVRLRGRCAAGGAPAAWRWWGAGRGRPGQRGRSSEGRGRPTAARERGGRQQPRAQVKVQSRQDKQPSLLSTLPELRRATLAAAAEGSRGYRTRRSQNHLLSLPRSNQVTCRAPPLRTVSDPPPYPCSTGAPLYSHSVEKPQPGCALGTE